jgi:hypothetical protein
MAEVAVKLAAYLSVSDLVSTKFCLETVEQLLPGLLGLADCARPPAAVSHTKEVIHGSNLQQN